MSGYLPRCTWRGTHDAHYRVENVPSRVGPQHLAGSTVVLRHCASVRPKHRGQSGTVVAVNPSGRTWAYQVEMGDGKRIAVEQGEIER